MNCQDIADRAARKINNIWHGLYVHCPVCGDMWSLDPDAYGQPAECQNCHEEMEEYTLYDWFNPDNGDILEVNVYKVRRRGESPHAVIVTIGYGGPNVYFDSDKEGVEVYWWGNYAFSPVDHDACEEILRLAQEDWDCQ